MHYEGTIDAPIPAKDFFAIVTDPTQIIALLPDVEQSRVNDRDHFFVKAKVGAGPLRGTVAMNFAIVEEKNNSVKLTGHGDGIQSVVDLSLVMVLEDTPNGSRARWSAEAKVGGLLAGVAGRLIESIADGYIRKITENLRKKVAGR